MARKLLLPLVAVVIIAAMVIPGCDGEPVEEWEPVDIKFIIRQDLYIPMFPAAGEYVGDLFEEAGFLVDRMRLTGPEAFAIWIPDDPMLGTYSAYTGGWGITSIPRDYASHFLARDSKYLRPWPRWLVLDPPAVYEDAMWDLYNRTYVSMAERYDLFETAAWQGMYFSAQVLLADVGGVYPFVADMNIQHDNSYGIGWCWPQTMHFHTLGVPYAGGDVLGEQYFMLSEPWNPVDGSGASADLNIFRTALQESGMMPDGRDGHYWPWRIKSADITIKDTLSAVVTAPIDWGGNLTLSFAAPATIEAPDTAWVGWNATTKQFITVAEKKVADPEFDPVAARKSVVVYPSDIFTVPMHDGTTLSIADFLMYMIWCFDHGDPDSEIYDEAQAGPLAALLENLKGFEITSLAPLTIETYSDLWYLDADWNVADWFPAYGLYDQFCPWHVYSIGWMAERDETLAFGADKSEELILEWLDYTKGPSLPVLNTNLGTATGAGFIPYDDFIRPYYIANVAGGEATLNLEIADRYIDLAAWYAAEGHFWVSTSPLYLDSVDSTNKIVELGRFTGHLDSADRWFFLMEDHFGEDFGRVPPTAGYPAHTGVWVDSVTISPGTAGAAVEKIKVGTECQIWFMLGITDPTLATTVDVHPNIDYRESTGSFAEIMFNVAGDEDGKFLDGKFNPFYFPKIREAFQWMVDRDHIVGEILGGMGNPIYCFPGSAFPEYARYGANIFNDIAEEYQQDKVRALAQIATVMEGLGAELRLVGLDMVWHFQVS